MSRFTHRRRFVRQHWRLQAETLFYLTWCQVALRAVAFKRLAPGLGASMLETPLELDPGLQAIARDVRLMIRVVAARLPWASSCLVRAMAARHVLRRRGLPCTLYLGVDPKLPPLRAHAWLRSGVVYVTGAPARQAYRPVTWFGCGVEAPPVNASAGRETT